MVLDWGHCSGQTKRERKNPQRSPPLLPHTLRIIVGYCGSGCKILILLEVHSKEYVISQIFGDFIWIRSYFNYLRALAQMAKRLPAMWETWVRSCSKEFENSGLCVSVSVQWWHVLEPLVSVSNDLSSLSCLGVYFQVLSLCSLQGWWYQFQCVMLSIY